MSDCSHPVWCTEQIKWICSACYTAKHGGPPPQPNDDVAHPKVIKNVDEIPTLNPDHSVHSFLMSLEHIFRYSADDISANLMKLDLQVLLAIRTFMCEKLQGILEEVKDIAPCQRRAVKTAVNDIITLGFCITSKSLVKGIGAVFAGCEPEAPDTVPDLSDILIEFQALKLVVSDLKNEVSGLKTKVDTLESENVSLKAKIKDTPSGSTSKDDTPLIQSDTSNTTFKVDINCSPFHAQLSWPPLQKNASRCSWDNDMLTNLTPGMC